MAPSRAAQEPTLIRDAGIARLSRLTRGATALALAGAGALSALAASTYHPRHTTSPPAAASAALSSSATLPTPAATVPVAGLSAGASGTAASAPAPPSSAPTASAAPPVVVSGSS